MKRTVFFAVMATVALSALMFAGASAQARKPGTSSSSAGISLNQDPSTLRLGSPVTFTTNAAGLTGSEYPMVYVECEQGTAVVYGQLDHPDATFVLGGGSSQWWVVGGGASCTAHLFAYGGKSQGNDTIRELATPVTFTVN